MQRSGEGRATGGRGQKKEPHSAKSLEVTRAGWRRGSGARSHHVRRMGSHKAISRKQPSKETRGHGWSALEMVATFARGIQNKCENEEGTQPFLLARKLLLHSLPRLL